VGPTGVGKTAVALELGRALPIEIVSVDSRQVYRRMDVGTGKPSVEERRRVPHHVMDVVDPDEPYHVARFVREAEHAIGQIRGRGRWPVLVGGTGLYYRALLRGLAPRPPADPALRERLRHEAAAAGPAALHRYLGEVDPAAAARLAANDVVRVTRALEVALLSGEPEDPARTRSWGRAAPCHPTVTVGLTMERGALYARLDQRVERMLASGLLAEVGALLDAGFAADLPAMQGIGYRHLAPVLAGRARPGEAVAEMKRDTRRYAKRQWTWFAREPDVTWLQLDPAGIATAVAGINKLIERTRLFDYPG
jgi:tRNA dimethylallyltransferase